jgi:hypothetical protein
MFAPGNAAERHRAAVVGDGDLGAESHERARHSTSRRLVHYASIYTSRCSQACDGQAQRHSVLEICDALLRRRYRSATQHTRTKRDRGARRQEVSDLHVDLGMPL